MIFKYSILIASHEPKYYLLEQIESIQDQTHQSWSVFLSDDSISNEWQLKYSEHLTKIGAKILQGPKIGFASNFLSLARNPELQSDLYAFCDQDDIWDKNKLEDILQIFTNLDNTIPRLYCGRTIIVDSDNQVIGQSPLFNRAPSFKNALIQNIGGGNTMVFNNAARNLLLACPLNLHVVSHDWFFYQLVTGAEGEVIYDPKPYVKYRQHDANLVGANIGWSARIRRIKLLLAGRFKDWNEVNVNALLTISHLLSPESKKTLQLFILTRASNSFLTRLFWLKRSGLYRQTFLGNLGLIIGLILRKV
ncbi:glycosyltransferase family 2 protein [Polynucleobacter paneuropaeus]|uniref:Glycosyltransferase family 2 protein n=1 Tax=Polynucleobacter paneuropaeus TaxID=2527775 RepID=A0ABX9F7L7_9BURK|nr:glycosyltransferase [Polynucleobacter paneuropaeus]RAZ40803.1 glycosyltransferase family 2 protein [Polynucleobacter paneuropaeus]